MSEQPSEVRDEIDQQIARYLVADPTATDESIASSLSIHKNTVQRRRRTMQDEHVLAPATEVLDWRAIGFPFRYRIDIQVNPVALRDEKQGGAPEDCPDELKPGFPINTQERLARFIRSNLVHYVTWRLKHHKEDSDRPRNEFQDFAKLLIVHDVTILLGHQADLSVMVRAKTQAALRKFVTSGLRMMRGVNSTDTSQEAWSCIEGDL